MEVTDFIKYIGVDDKELDLFESQYKVPNGISYNSYIIEDEKIVVMDTVDKRKQEDWISNLEKELNGRKVDYLVVSHLEPDHSASIKVLVKKYPNMKIIGNTLTFKMLPQFIESDIAEERKVTVKEGDILNVGNHTLKFIMAPMIHWPEVMMIYEEKEKVLFTADAFGKFGSLDTKEDWDHEARRYYFNIVGKYGIQVQTLLKKIASLDIKMICPLHGPILKENLEFYINKYDIWSSYTPENNGVLIAYNSIYGNTEKAVQKLEQILIDAGAKKVVVSNLAREDIAEVIEDAFRYDKMILACPTYDAGLFPDMEKFLNELKSKNYQNRIVGIVENGSWAPTAAKNMQEILNNMKNIKVVEPIIHIKTAMNNENEEAMKALTDTMLNVNE